MKIKRPLKTIALAVLLFDAVSLAGAEIACRKKLGLGDPPLFKADKDIEYLFKPSIQYHRFGNLLSYNDYSMRIKNSFAINLT